MGRATYLPLRRGPSSLTSRGRPFDTMAVRLPAAVVAFLASLALVGSGAAQTRSDPALQRRLAHALRVPHVRPSQTGALAVELATGLTVFAENAAVPFAPASTEKLPVTLAALAVDRAHYRGAVSTQPALGAALAFRDTLRAAGIAVAGRPATGRADAEAFPLVSVTSPTLATVVRGMDLESDNFTAELLVKELGAIAADRGTTVAGAAVVTKQLAAAGVPLAGVRIVDGSGLSLLDRLTPHALVGILEAAWATPQVRDRFVAALPVAGVSGTLHDRMRRAPARGNVVAKTGTTSIASALSGFVRGRYVFAVVHNGHPVSSWWARVAQDRFATVLAAQ